ncbi:MAG: TonB-dependent receptor [Bacteroidales bacterium]
MQGRRLFAVACSLLLYLGVCATAVHAQAIHEGKLTGTVRGEDKMVMPGVTVEVASAALMGRTRTTVTSGTGTYVFLNLPSGSYKVTAALSGFKTIAREDIQIDPDKTITLDFTLPVGSISETVNVSAEAPRIDVQAATVDSALDRNLIAKLPTNRDAFYDLALTTPGMFSSASSNSLPSPTAYGSPTNENVFLINGVNATNPEASSFGTLVNVNYDAVDQVRVVASGTKAEYGNFSGVAVDVITKSGSNMFHGSGALYSKLGSPANNQPAPGSDVGASWLYVPEGLSLLSDTKQSWEASATAGGPIQKDKVWFFGAFDYKRSDSYPPAWPLLQKFWDRYADAKVSFLPSPKHLVWGAYHYENNDANGLSWGVQPGWDTTTSYGSKPTNNTVAAQWQWTATRRNVVSAKFMGFWKNDAPYLPADHMDHPAYINWWKWADYGLNGAFPYIDNQKASRQTVQADMSHYTEGYLGTHDLKFGVQYTKGRGNRQEGYFQNYANFLYPMRWTQNVEYMQNWYGDTAGLMFYNHRDTIHPFLTVRSADTAGLFIDDKWTPNKRVTITLGLRFDRMTTKYEQGTVYDYLATPDVSTLTETGTRAATDNIFDFKTWSPRLGISYALTTDGKTVARAAYGRYYTPLTIEYLRRFGPDVPLVDRLRQEIAVPWNQADANGDGFIDAPETRDAARIASNTVPLLEEARTVNQSWTLNVAPDLKDQFTDEVSLNFEREVARNTSVSVTYIYKRSGDMFANVPINRVTGQEWAYDRVPFKTLTGQTVNLYSVKLQDFNGDGAVNGDDVTWVGDNNTSKVVNMPAYDGVTPFRHYHGLQFVFSKRYSERWQALGSFLYSSSSGMARRSLRQDVNVEGPMFWDDNWMGSLNQTINNLTGPLPFTPKYEFKLSGSYIIPKIEFDVGARLRVASGRPLWQLEGYPTLASWNFGQCDGCVIDTGGTGQIVAVTEPSYLPTQALLDLHFDKTFKVQTNTLHIVVDAFNVFNSSAPTDADISNEWGRITAIPQSRRFRLGVKFEF